MPSEFFVSNLSLLALIGTQCLLSGLYFFVSHNDRSGTPVAWLSTLIPLIGGVLAIGYLASRWTEREETSVDES